jgi:hypothetical protein
MLRQKAQPERGEFNKSGSSQLPQLHVFQIRRSFSQSLG